MTAEFLSLATTPAVRREQQRYYGASRPIITGGEPVPFTEDETTFIEERDSFYLSTVSETGWPYIQHRGGSPGFLKVTGPRSLAFADYKGNRQLISSGNIAGGSRVALFLTDYPRQTRLKILGFARTEDVRSHPDLVAQWVEPKQRSKVERLFFIDVAAFDWNCPQHITPRYTLAEVEQMVLPLRERIADLTQKIEPKGKP